jgi:hypothetical protein
VKNVVIFVLAIITLFLFVNFEPSGRVYDCGMAEWHPDIPIVVKEECRKLRLEEYQRKKYESMHKT